MEKYFAAKRLLFDGTVYPAPRVAVINAHDPRAEELAAAARKAGAEVRTYGIGQGDWRAAELHAHSRAAQFSISKLRPARRKSPRASPARSTSSTCSQPSPLPTRAASLSPISSKFVPTLKPVPGRFQSVDAGQPFTVIVDYAHTDDALRNLTALARQMTARIRQAA